jgi:hypothetical protein
VTETIASAPAGQEPAESEVTPRMRLTEGVLDNLPLWFVVSAAIGFLYLVWATIEILNRYVGGLPQITP